MKLCTKCNISKELSEYHQNGSRGHCILCVNASNREWYYKNKKRRNSKSREWWAANPEKTKGYEKMKKIDVRLAANLKYNFNLSLEAFRKLEILQNKVCAICKGPPTPARTRLSVDHDHASGQIRGLLCDNCNLALGRMKDSPALLREAALYLECAKPSLAGVFQQDNG